MTQYNDLSYAAFPRVVGTTDVPRKCLCPLLSSLLLSVHRRVGNRKMLQSRTSDCSYEHLWLSSLNHSLYPPLLEKQWGCHNVQVNDLVTALYLHMGYSKPHSLAIFATHRMGMNRLSLQYNSSSTQATLMWNFGR